MSDREVRVSPERLEGWIARFAEHHSPGGPDTLITSLTPDALLLAAADGATASLLNLWLDPLPPSDDPIAGFLTHVGRKRRVALLLARKSAHAVGIAFGTDLEVHRVATHYIQGRTKAGGWSQQRYARRRGNQASKAFSDAHDDVAELLLPRVSDVEGLACGGDRTAVAAVLEGFDSLEALRTRHRVLATPDPRLVILADFASEIRKVPIVLNDLASLTA